MEQSVQCLRKRKLLIKLPRRGGIKIRFQLRKFFVQKVFKEQLGCVARTTAQCQFACRAQTRFNVLLRLQPALFQ